MATSAPARASAIVVMAASLLLSTIAAGLRVPAEETLRGPAPRSTLDYVSLSGPVAPLANAWATQALGLQPRPVVPESSGRPDVSPGPVRDGSVPPTWPGVDVIHPPTNDDLADAYRIGSIPFTARTDASGAGRERGEPSDCSPFGPTLWYVFTAPADMRLAASTSGTRGAAGLAAFNGEPRRLEEVACDSSVGGHATVVLWARKQETFWFQVTAPTRTQQVVFHLEPVGVTERVSLTRNGEPANGDSFVNSTGSISADGRYVTFASAADNLVPGDANGVLDVFVHDRVTGTTERVSVSSDGEEANDASDNPEISANGRFVAFYSTATNLVDGDTNGWTDAFVHDLQTGTTERLSVSSAGREGQPPVDPVWFGAGHVCRRPDDSQRCVTHVVGISDDGSRVAFESDLTGLVEGDDDVQANTSGFDVFVRDRRAGTTVLASRSSQGEDGNGQSGVPRISGDGRFVAFRSAATNLVADDRNECPDATGAWSRVVSAEPGGCLDVFVHDLVTGTTERVSVASDGSEANGASYWLDISRDGRHVAFVSLASNLVEDDDNSMGDVFVHDRLTGRTELVSVSSEGSQQSSAATARGIANLATSAVSISADGRFVAFDSEAANLVVEDHNDTWDVFVRDRLLGRTTLASVSTAGAQGDAGSAVPSLSHDGRSVAFYSVATNLAEGGDGGESEPSNGRYNVFVHDLFVPD